MRISVELQTLMGHKKSDTEAFNRSVAALYKTRMISDPEERDAMLRTGEPQTPLLRASVTRRN